MQYDCYPYKKKRLGHKHMQKEDHMKTQEEDHHVQAKDRPQKKSTLPIL